MLDEVLCVQWTNELNRSNGFFISWIILLIFDGLIMLFSGGMLFYSVRIDTVRWNGTDVDYFGKGWICWKNNKKPIGVTRFISSVILSFFERLFHDENFGNALCNK